MSGGFPETARTRDAGYGRNRGPAGPGRGGGFATPNLRHGKYERGASKEIGQQLHDLPGGRISLRNWLVQLCVVRTVCDSSDWAKTRHQ